MSLCGCTLILLYHQGKRLWRVALPAAITAMAAMLVPGRGFSGFLVALSSCELRLYQDQVLVSSQRTPDSVSAVVFGRYGREDGTVVMATRGGGLLVRIDPAAHGDVRP